MTPTPSNPATEAPTPGAASELLPCNFCGEVPTGCEHRDVTGEGYYAVECHSRKCHDAGRFVGAHGDDVEDVHRAWNTRTPAPVTEGAQREAVAIDPRDEPHMGIYEKYRVERTNGSSGPGGKHEHCDYFVLDLTHDPHAYAAITSYAKSCGDDYPALANDLLEIAHEMANRKESK